MYDGYLAEIRGFAGPFAPANWAYCDGQTLQIDQFTALFSLLGTNFGGNGVTTFNLPDLRGRAFIHHGKGDGLTKRVFSEASGFEAITLTDKELPTHTHHAETQGGVGSLSGHATAKVFVNNGASDNAEPADRFFGVAEGGNDYADSKDNSSILNSRAIEVDTSGLDVNVSGINVSINNAGGSYPHFNMQPYLVMSFIICTQGLYPSRS